MLGTCIVKAFDVSFECPANSGMHSDGGQGLAMKMDGPNHWKSVVYVI